MFSLVITARRGSPCNMPGAWQRYRTLGQAPAAAATLLRDERVTGIAKRVTRIAIVRNEAPPAFVEWENR